ncbi:hypothetical protein HMPREF0083_00950 [Aneurinibacillus aneurinilyticus ATCC 12856]|uniref:Uncharacterized protein n=1 Tax=Aneurinibacillus aneurinilyticus ATCC 12856 TaxID=649747 RepID=U1X7J1_ANEAE|nr:hypothetical protein HMPREF0083_00950 [Aneurinibacillus aneurinilyticus ATCC 12856]
MVGRRRLGKKKRLDAALRSGRREASMSFSDGSRPPPLLLFLLPTIKICPFIKSGVYREAGGCSPSM